MTSIGTPSDLVIKRPHQTGPQPSSGTPLPRYEEEEEDEDEDCYAPELPPELAAARASTSGPPRRTMGPAARGPLRREEEEEESEDEIGPLPPPPPHAGAGPPNAGEDAVAEFMQKEAQRRQAVEVRRCPPCALAVTRLLSSFVSRFAGGRAPQDAAAPGVDARTAIIVRSAEQCVSRSLVFHVLSCCS